ncbi:MAG: hypothetical protein M3Y08_19850 [Fibrobacterota bacterium]|nr:hypothetical protein [Fibrobacterota bacterium]
MSELYRRIPIEDEKTPVAGVVYHPIAEKKLRRGENVSPIFLVAPYEYESPLQEICAALGWQGGTLNQVVGEVLRLKATCKDSLQVREIASTPVAPQKEAVDLEREVEHLIEDYLFDISENYAAGHAGPILEFLKYNGYEITRAPVAPAPEIREAMEALKRRISEVKSWGESPHMERFWEGQLSVIYQVFDMLPTVTPSVPAPIPQAEGGKV